MTRGSPPHPRPCCRYDSVPSELGTQQTVEAIREKFGEPTRRVDNFVVMKGELSGGTLESGIQMEKNPELFQMLKVCTCIRVPTQTYLDTSTRVSLLLDLPPTPPLLPPSPRPPAFPKESVFVGR